MKWYQAFLDEHGGRLIFLLLATLFGIGFVWAGYAKEIPELKGAGATFLIAVGTIALNQARGAIPQGGSNDDEEKK